jgi:TolB-like protein
MPTVQSFRRACSLGALVLGLFAPALHAQSADRRPSIAVLDFNNAALINGAEYEPLTKGMAEMLITTLTGNPGLRVVERARLQKLVDEQNLGSSGRVDKETAARIGKLVGAQHMLKGSFAIDRKQMVRLDAQAVNTETSEIEHAETVSGRADDLFMLIDQLGRKLNAGLKLPPMPLRVSQPTAPGGPTEVAKGGPNQFRAMMLVSRALERQDRGDTAGAIALYRSALQEYPNFERARTLLASAEGGPGARPTQPD